MFRIIPFSGIFEYYVHINSIRAILLLLKLGTRIKYLFIYSCIRVFLSLYTWYLDTCSIDKVFAWYSRSFIFLKMYCLQVLRPCIYIPPSNPFFFNKKNPGPNCIYFLFIAIYAQYLIINFWWCNLFIRLFKLIFKTAFFNSHLNMSVENAIFKLSSKSKKA